MQRRQQTQIYSSRVLPSQQKVDMATDFIKHIYLGGDWGHVTSLHI